MTQHRYRILGLDVFIVLIVLGLLIAQAAHPQGSCVSSSVALCLSNAQFEVQVHWTDFEGKTGPGRVVDPRTDDSGLFWFFNPSNWEMLVKVLDGCSINGQYWVFAAATTNVDYELTVRHVESGVVRSYRNSLGVSSPAITDTGAFGCEPEPTSRKIVPPRGGGMYLGQHEWAEGDIATLEETAGQHAALWTPHEVFVETLPPEAPTFDVEAAVRSWNEGRAVLVGAWDAVDLAQSGIGIDRVLAGEFDVALSQLAAAFRAFGRPMFFSAGREPNGVGVSHLGGFGTDGTDSFWDALETQSGFDRFDPSKFPNAHLYADLGDPQKCDGVERLTALHRYYHDFFVRREGLDFLTFDGMGWAAATAELIYQNEVLERGFDDPESRRLALNCLDYRNFYPGDDSVDWLTFTFYMADFLAADWPGIEEDILIPNEFWLDQLGQSLDLALEVAPNKPIFFIELGMPDGKTQDSRRAAERVEVFFEFILSGYPQVAGFSLWSFAEFFDDPESPFYFPFDCLLRPGTQQGNAFRAILDANPDRFHSCVQFADGTSMPGCS